MPSGQNFLPKSPIFLGKTVIRFSGSATYRELNDNIAILHMQISGDILLDELEPDAGHLSAATVSANEELQHLYRIRASVASMFRREFVGGGDPQFHVNDSLALFYVHMNRAVCSLPVVMFHFEDDAWGLFDLPLADSASQWNSATDKLASTKLEYSRIAQITRQDFETFCARKGCDASTIEAKARFLVRTVNRVTSDDLSGLLEPIYRPDPTTPVPEHSYRPSAKDFKTTVRPDPTLGEIYLTAMRYMLERHRGFKPFTRPPRFEFLVREPIASPAKKSVSRPKKPVPTSRN